MGYRTALLVACMASLGLTACSDEGPSREELQGHIRSLEGQLGTARDKATDLDAAVEQLQAEVERFDDENWRDVVGDVRAATEQVGTARDEMSEAVEER